MQSDLNLCLSHASSVLVMFDILFLSEYCAANGYQCNDGSCISDSKVCDAIPDCPNGEDELNCGKFRIKR